MGAALAEALNLPGMGPPLSWRTWLLAVAVPGAASREQAASGGAAAGTPVMLLLLRIACVLALVWVVVYVMAGQRVGMGQHLLGGSQKPLLLPIKVQGGRSPIMRGLGAGALASKGY